jgi:hypothetical protein
MVTEIWKSWKEFPTLSLSEVTAIAEGPNDCNSLDLPQVFRLALTSNIKFLGGFV